MKADYVTKMIAGEVLSCAVTPSFSDYPETERHTVKRVVVGAVAGAAVGGLLRLAHATKGTTCSETCYNNGQRSNAFFFGWGAAFGALVGWISAHQ